MNDKKHQLGPLGGFVVEHENGDWTIDDDMGMGNAVLTPKEAHALYLILTNKFAQVGSDA